MKVSRLIVPAAAAVLLTGGLSAPAQAKTAHCADFKSPDKVELSGDSSTVNVPEDVDYVCLKAGTAVFNVKVAEDGTISSGNGKGISYWIPIECPPKEYDCDGGGGSGGS